MIIDMHTHAGRPRRTGEVDRRVLATMRPAGVAAAVVAAVPDIPVLRVNRETGMLDKVRAPNPNECLDAADSYLTAFEQSGTRIAREPEDFRPDDPALVLAIEGCDFLEGDLDRLDLMEARGVRSIQLTHYLVNELGDIQTAPPVHGGLTAFGAEAVRRMNHLGMIVDVAHCSEATVRDIADVATRPFICSHGALEQPDGPSGVHPRFLSRNYARMVAESGGVVGASVALLRADKFPGLVQQIFRMIDLLGINHVGIGSDLPAGVAATEMPDFSRHPELAAAMRARGMTEEEVEKVCSANWLRVLKAVRA